MNFNCRYKGKQGKYVYCRITLKNSIFERIISDSEHEKEYDNYIKWRQQNQGKNQGQNNKKITK